MLRENNVFSSFAVSDVDEAQRFYGETLGVNVEVLDAEVGLLSLHHGGGQDTLVYAKPDLDPANYTVLNFQVDDVDAAVDELSGRGVTFERYEGLGQDDKGVSRGMGPTIAWFKDPAGNILSVVEPQ
jgi:catechol 2,3-dioxygenase-like lactoylglutathione lyase family enzyme